MTDDAEKPIFIMKVFVLTSMQTVAWHSYRKEWRTVYYQTENILKYFEYALSVFPAGFSQ